MNKTIFCLFLLIILFNFSYSLPRYCGYIPPELPPSIPPISEDYELIQVITLIRHGDRSIANGDPCWNPDNTVWECNLTITSIPNTDLQQTEIKNTRLFRKKYLPHVEELKGNCEVGQLTVRGLEQEENNGKVYRSAYVESGFLDSTFNASQIYIRSDDEDRTQQSAQGFINGLFPVNNNTNTAEIINLHSMDKQYDSMSPNGNLCPVYNTVNYAALHSPEFGYHFAEITAPLLADLGNATNMFISNFDLSHLWDCANDHTCNGKPSPINEELYVRLGQELKYQNNLTYTYPNRTYQSQIGIGFLINEMYRHMELQIKFNNNYKFLLYSGHDGSIMPWLSALSSSYDGYWSPYASTGTLELYKDPLTTSYYVRLLFRGEPMMMYGCSQLLCDWDDFSKTIESLVPPDDYKEFCKTSNWTM
eukprot:TRINITY_DN11891_c0_g1_i1.p1 TRINITY_DN11891_c0_g1~~TRINITY_DN11891_c0_g1_i1.p1  ORF type:complete len:420 (+),score=125.89 TRINITY_DN11891_c0_g1_i1:55-1314(+)